MKAAYIAFPVPETLAELPLAARVWLAMTPIRIFLVLCVLSPLVPLIW